MSSGRRGLVNGRAVGFVLTFLVVLLGWGISSPVGSAPDDDYHLSSIWCAPGERAGVCELDPADPMARMVPQDVVEAYACYAFDAEVNASCTQELTTALVSTTRVNETAGLYPPWYYRFMSVFVGPDAITSVLVMRVFNVLLATALLFGALIAAPRGISRAAATAVMITYLPIGLYVIPSTNPSSWAITGIAALWAFGLSMMLQRRWTRRTWFLASGASIGALIAMAARLDASVYVGITVVVIGIAIGLQRVRAQRPGALLLVMLSALGLLVYLTIEPPVAPGGPALGTPDRGIGLLLTNLAHTPVYLQAALGGPLGWLDIILPTWVPIVGTLALGFVLYRQLAFGFSRVLISSLAALAAFLLVPVAFLQLGGLLVGELIQPRYLLPLLVVFVATANLGPKIKKIYPWPPWVVGMLTPALAIGSVLAYWVMFHRYAAGASQGLFDKDVVIEWGGLSPIPWILVVGATAVASVAFYVIGSGYLLSSRQQPDKDVTAH